MRFLEYEHSFIEIFAKFILIITGKTGKIVFLALTQRIAKFFHNFVQGPFIKRFLIVHYRYKGLDFGVFLDFTHFFPLLYYLIDWNSGAASGTVQLENQH